MKKGFTLIELLAVILILGIILGITFYQTSKSTEFARQQALEESTKNIIKAADTYYADLGYTNFPINGISIKDLELKSTGFKSGTIKLINNEYTVVNLTDGKYCINGTKENLNIVKGDCGSSSNTNYVYYASLNSYNDETGMPEPISIDDCSEIKPNGLVYLKFSVQNNELGTPMVCTSYFDDELCYGEGFLEHTDDLLHKFGYYNSDWVNNPSEGETVKQSPDGKTMCGYNSEFIACVNEDIKAYIEISNQMLYIADNKEGIVCGVGIFNGEYMGHCED